MIKILDVSVAGDFELRVAFSNGVEGLFDGRALLARSGPLLEPLRDSAYFARAFVDAGGCAGRMGLSCRQRGYSSNVGFCRGFDQGGKGQVLHLLIACPLRRHLKRHDRRRRRAALVACRGDFACSPA